MKSQFINLNEAATLINKSTQTLRRLIKSNKIKYRRKKTPQGFIYFIDISSLKELFSKYLNGNALHQMSSLDESLHSIDINAQSIQDLLPEYNVYSTAHSIPSFFLSNIAEDNQHHSAMTEHSNQSRNISSDKSTQKDFFVINSGQPVLIPEKKMETDHIQGIPISLYCDNKKCVLINQQIDHIYYMIRKCGVLYDDFPYSSNINTVLINQLGHKIQTLSNALESIVQHLQKAENIFNKVSKKWWQFWK